ncbi:MAG: prolipoprotein diacylglyceryl transferase [Campylobacterota bacterium]|nr:prolipoprotein diacylglyceryl transferase [Campylobacterota bacterium]
MENNLTHFWNTIYSQFDPVAFHLGSFSVHWYGIMYVLALLSTLLFAKWIAKHDKMPISDEELDNYFIWVEIGVILGARFGYVLFYDTHTSYYLTHPWQIFNPFMNGEFVGIRGMSFHGAVIGFIIASLGFLYRNKNVNFGTILDIAAISIPFGYIFGRIGNFLNQELIGKATDLPWGIYVHETLRHPSQLYEAFLEGVVIFIIIFIYRKYKRFNGELIIVFPFLYGIMRFIAEFWREPDIQIGYICCGWLSMGQALSLLMSIVAAVCWVVFSRLLIKNKKLQ